jgi:hypothetical protein
MDAEAKALSGPEYSKPAEREKKKKNLKKERKRTSGQGPSVGPVGSWPGQSLSGSLPGPSQPRPHTRVWGFGLMKIYFFGNFFFFLIFFFHLDVLLCVSSSILCAL